MKKKYLLILIAVVISEMACNPVSKNNTLNENANDSDSIAASIDSSIDSEVNSEKAVKAAAINVDSIIKVMRGSFTFRKDEFKEGNFMWVEPKNKPYYDNVNKLYCYFAMIDGVPQNFRMRLHYAADDWLFINSWIIRLDSGLKFEVSCDDPIHNNNGDGIWEICDVQMTAFEQSMLDAILCCNSAKIKMIGSDYYNTRKITSNELKYIKLSYEYYRKLGGKLE